MALYLDTEFNGFGGKLISIGLVSSKTGKEFYGVLPLSEKIHPWVQEHVIPYLISDSEPWYELRHRLYAYLKYHEGEEIIADWPADIEHLMSLLYEDNGMSFNLELDIRLIKSGKLKADFPHNALSDARALMHWHINQKQS
jgi:hypothetical protein